MFWYIYSWSCLKVPLWSLTLHKVKRKIRGKFGWLFMDTNNTKNLDMKCGWKCSLAQGLIRKPNFWLHPTNTVATLPYRKVSTYLLTNLHIFTDFHRHWGFSAFFGQSTKFSTSRYLKFHNQVKCTMTKSSFYGPDIITGT